MIKVFSIETQVQTIIDMLTQTAHFRIPSYALMLPQATKQQTNKFLKQQSVCPSVLFARLKGALLLCSYVSYIVYDIVSSLLPVQCIMSKFYFDNVQQEKGNGNLTCNSLVKI